MNWLRRNFNFLHHVVREADRDDCLGMAAEVGFQLMFALFPSLILTVAVLSIFSANPEVFRTIVSFFSGFVPYELYILLRDQVMEIATGQKSGMFTIGLVGTTWTVSTLMLTLHKSFLRSYNIKETRPFWKIRLIAFLLALTTVLLAALVMNLLIFGLHIAQWLETRFGHENIIAGIIRAFRIPAAFMVTTFLAGLLYWSMSNVRQMFIEVLPGSIFFSVLWFIFTYAFGFYIGNFGSYNATYGTLATGMVLLAWMYLTALSLLIGSEVNAEIYRRKNLIHSRH